MQVSVIIVTYNTKQMTAECIDSVFEKTKDVDFEIVLVDNASSDGSKEFFEKDARIKYVYSNENLGFGRANNLGYEHAEGEYIFLLNSDTLLVNNAIKLFCDYMQSQSRSVGCVGCVLQRRDGSRMHSYHTAFPSLSWIFYEILGVSIPKLFHPYEFMEKRQSKDFYPQKVAVITGADLFIRRCVIEECGLFDADFFMYYEETEMQYRFSAKGYASYVIDSAKIIHLAGASSKKKHHLERLQAPLKSRYIYARKVFSPMRYVAFRLMHLIMIPRVVLSRVSLQTKKKLLGIILG